MTSAVTVLADGLYSGTDQERGHLVQAQVDHKFTDSISGYLGLEHFIPGDFYAGAQDDAMFVRWQMQFKF